MTKACYLDFVNDLWYDLVELNCYQLCMITICGNYYYFMEISIHDKNIYTLMKLDNLSYKATEDRNDKYIKGALSEYLTIRIINYMTEHTLTCGITLFSIKSLCISPSLLCIILRSL